MFRSFFFTASQRVVPAARKLSCLIFAMMGLATATQAAEQRINLPNGGYVTVDPDYDLPGTTPVANVGLVRWYDQNSSLISAVHGSTANDRVGSGGVTVVGNDNFLISSPSWDNGAVVDAGALTFSEVLMSFFGTSGHHAVSATNSRVGSATGDLVVSGNAAVIGTGGFVVCCPQWDNGAATDAGAVITGGVFTGYGVFSGVVSASNALVGSSANDQVGSGGIHQPFGIETAPVVHSPLWDNGGVANVGAVTFLFLPGDPQPAHGVISAMNSLMGSSANDQIGSGGIIPRPFIHGTALVHSPLWDNGGAEDAGAVTALIPPGHPSATIGVVTSANSLVGASAGDRIGSGGLVQVPNQGIVVHSPLWDKAGAADAGAVTLFCWPLSPDTFAAGTVSATNSLVGSSAGDQIGSGGITWVNEVGIVVSSPLWDNAGTANAGAVTLMANPLHGLSTVGMVSSTNSLVGSSTDDQVGSGGIVSLEEMGALVRSPLWDNAGALNAGAVTILTPHGSGGTLTGVVSAANSLVGSSAGDQIGSGGLTVLGGMGEVLVRSPLWDNVGAVDAGAVTIMVPPWIGLPTVGAISAANSLVGSSPDDQVGSGGVTLMGEGDIVVSSPLWDNGSAANAGAVTLMPTPMTGFLILGVVSAANSVVGSSAEDQVGSGGFTLMDERSIVVSSPQWDNGSAANAGAVTLMTSAAVGPPTVGVVSAMNSLVGSSAGDQVGSGGIMLAEIGEAPSSTLSFVLVRSPLWDNGSAANAGAVTFLPPPWLGFPTVGEVSAANSWVGSSANDQVGSGGVEELGVAFVVKSPEWSGGAGALTFCWPLIGPPSGGVVSGANSLVGSTANDSIGSGGITPVGDYGFLVHSPLWDNGGASNAGALTFITEPWAGSSSGVVSAENSLVGSSTNDQVGGTAVIVFPESGTFAVHTPFWDNGSAADAGAVTVGQPPMLGGQFKGAISAANSLVGTSTNDRVGSGGVTVESVPGLGISLMLLSPLWNNGAVADAGAVTISTLHPFSPTIGAISSANSLVGSSANDQVGSGSIARGAPPNFALLLTSPLWDNGGAADAGAVTLVQFGNTSGTISASNSMVGSTANDQVGRDGAVPFANDGFVVLSPVWDNGGLVDAGAFTMGRVGLPFTGTVSASNSYVGSSANDQLGSGGAKIFGSNFCLIHSPLWDHRTATDAGAITWLTDANPFGTELNDFNSLMGSHPNDRIGSGGIMVQANPQVTILSPNWCYGAGAVTHVTYNGGWMTSGVVTSWNSIVGPENAEPEFALQRPVGNDVAENSTHPFGAVTIGSSSSLNFTVRNRGLDDLFLVPRSGPNSQVRIQGPDAAMFSLPTVPHYLLVTGDSAGLTVNFSPTSQGPKTATLTLYISIDGLAPPREFSISLTGTGEAVTVGNWRQTHFGSSANTGDGADNADYDRDGIPNLVEYALGLNPTQSTTGQLPVPVRSGGNFTLSFTAPNSVGGIIYGAEWSTSLVGGSWQPVTNGLTPPQHFFSVPIGGNTKIFMRLKVTPAPPP